MQNKNIIFWFLVYYVFVFFSFVLIKNFFIFTLVLQKYIFILCNSAMKQRYNVFALVKHVSLVQTYCLTMLYIVIICEIKFNSNRCVIVCNNIICIKICLTYIIIRQTHMVFYWFVIVVCICVLISTDINYVLYSCSINSISLNRLYILLNYHKIILLYCFSLWSYVSWSYVSSSRIQM